MPTGDIMRATLEGTFDGEPVMIGLGFRSQSAAPDFPTDAQGLADAIYAALDLGGTPGAFMGPLSEHYTLNAIRVQDMNPGVAAGYVSTYGVPGGNATDDALPPNDALCVSWYTGLKGKSQRGRSYLTGFAEDSQVSGFWIAEIQTWAQTAFAGQLMASFGPPGTGDYVLVLIHETAGGVRIVPSTSTDIVSYRVHNEVRSLRRRGIGVRISRHRTTP